MNRAVKVTSTVYDIIGKGLYWRGGGGYLEVSIKQKPEKRMLALFNRMCLLL